MLERTASEGVNAIIGASRKYSGVRKTMLRRALTRGRHCGGYVLDMSAATRDSLMI